MVNVLHILDRLTGAGPTRSLINLVKLQRRLGLPYAHKLITLQREAYPIAVLQAKQAGLAVLRQPDEATLRDELAKADLVQVHFWNNPFIYDFLATGTGHHAGLPRPPMRLLVWSKVVGDHAPQVITPWLVDYADMLVATSPHTLTLPVMQPAVAAHRAAVVYGIADFDRLAGLVPRPHETFNVGYIGTLNFSKMHPDFVSMSAGAKIPAARFILCGAGGGEDTLNEQARRLGAEDRFLFQGFVENIKSVLETLDVFGYPLCEDTYATSEMSLQEAMYAGVPPVVFPYGGVKYLVEHGQTGLVVHSAAEYTAAIEFLYHHPDERQRLGRNAQAYAREQFAGDRPAHQFDELYQRLLDLPKRERVWSGVGGAGTPAERFVEALADTAPHFRVSLAGANSEAEQRIMASPALLATGEGGIIHYRNTYPNDPHLRFWSGLVLLGQDRPDAALREFEAAVTLGLDSQRVAAYLADASAR